MIQLRVSVRGATSWVCRCGFDAQRGTSGEKWFSSTAPHTPTEEDRVSELIRGLPLKPKHFQDEESLYLCVVQRVRAKSWR